jgi:type III pantothenate kinase
MLLCVDIANADTTLGLFEGERLVATWRLASDARRTEDEYSLQLTGLLTQGGHRPDDLHSAIIGCVVPPLLPVWQTVCRRLITADPLVVGAGVKTGLRIRTESPRRLGADRVANAVAARALFGGPLCIVDFGTTTTFDALAADGDYLGHAIAPGLDMAATALSAATAQLPEVILGRPSSAIGRNTVESIQAGLLFGFVGLVEGMVARFRAELGPAMRVIATGRHASLIAAETTVIERVEPWLTLHGLRLIGEMNAPSF